MLETLKDSRDDRRAECSVLVYLLSYGDLLARASAAFVLGQRRPITIGRGEDAPAGFPAPTSFLLPDGWMSAEHALIDKRGDADILVDLDSSNGTRVNGHPISEQRLDDGDLIEVGHSLLVYRRIPEEATSWLLGSQPDFQLGPTRSLCVEVMALINDLTRIAPSAEPVLILAETGAGKELCARAIHEMSGRSGELRAVDCGAIPENLFESTFFGHRKGAFTGADDTRIGEIQRANHGTLFLDEVGNMSPASQAKLLRVIETGEVTPVGEAGAEKVDVRWVAATNRDLFEPEHSFRHDLLRRLAGYVARLPPLRARREDLGELTAHLLGEVGVASASISVEAARTLFAGSFPGNIRQLRSSLRSAALLAGDDPITTDDLPTEQPAAGAAATDQGRAVPADASDQGRIEVALAQAGGNVSKAARTLSTSARQLYRWIDKYRIDLDSFRG